MVKTETDLMYENMINVNVLQVQVSYCRFIKPWCGPDLGRYITQRPYCWVSRGTVDFINIQAAGSSYVCYLTFSHLYSTYST